MRIVMVDPRGDSRPYDEALATALQARGHDVELVTSRYRHSDLPPATGIAVRERFYRVADRLPGRLRRAARGLEHPIDLALLLARLARRRPDVVHVQWLPLHAVDRCAWRLARRLLRRPLVYTAHNAAPKHGVGSARQIELDCAPFDGVVVHSAFGAGALAGLGVAADRIAQIHHGAFAGYAAVAPAPPPVPADAPLVAFVGLIRPYKGLDVLLRAWPRVRAAIPAATLLVCGKPLGGAVPAPPDGVILLLDYVSAGAFAGAIRRADVLAVPYRSIDSSGVLLAAIALGTPFVASDVGGIRQLAEETGAGVVVPPERPDALADALIELLNDPGRRAAMGAAGTAAAAGPLSFARAAELHEALYSSLTPCDPPRS
jgi:glycosyltransferase involved in cell wall biosynthesis